MKNLQDAAQTRKKGRRVGGMSIKEHPLASILFWYEESWRVKLFAVARFEPWPLSKLFSRGHVSANRIDEHLFHNESRESLLTLVACFFQFRRLKPLILLTRCRQFCMYFPLLRTLWENVLEGLAAICAWGVSKGVFGLGFPARFPVKYCWVFICMGWAAVGSFS